MATVYVKAGGAVPSVRTGTAASNTYVRSLATPSSSGSSSARTLQDTSGGSIPGVSGYLQQLQQMTAQNNAWSAQQAQKQMDFQRESADRAMAFEADQAKLNRGWQEYMSNTAHQREIKDLQAAGLNPVLSATGGQGAPVTSGATASGHASQGAKGDTDTSGTQAYVTLLSTMLSAQTQLLAQSMSAQNALAVADKYTAASRFGSQLSAASARDVARINQQTSYGVADINANTSVRVAQIHAGATLGAANISALASQAVASINSNATLRAAGIHASAGVLQSALTAAASVYNTRQNTSSNERIAAANRVLQSELMDKRSDLMFELQENQHTHELELQMKGFLGGAASSGLGSALGDALREFGYGYGGTSFGYATPPSIMTVPRIGG